MADTRSGGVYKDATGDGYHNAEGEKLDKGDAERAVSQLTDEKDPKKAAARRREADRTGKAPERPNREAVKVVTESSTAEGSRAPEGTQAGSRAGSEATRGIAGAGPGTPAPGSESEQNAGRLAADTSGAAGSSGRAPTPGAARRADEPNV